MSVVHCVVLPSARKIIFIISDFQKLGDISNFFFFGEKASDHCSMMVLLEVSFRFVFSFSFGLIYKGQYYKCYSREQFFVSIAVSCHRDFLSIGFKTFMSMTGNVLLSFSKEVSK